MTVPTKEEIREHLKLHKREYPRIDVAKHLGVSKSRLDNCLSKETMPESMAFEIAKFTGMLKTPIEQIIPDNLVTLKVPHDDYGNWEQAALKSNSTVSDWLINTGNEHAAELLASEFGIVAMPMPKKKANIMAAAGSGIEAEVIDWEGDNDTINVRVAGLSMIDTFNDDDVVTFRSKKASRSPYMKKGLIYLVELDGKMLIKEYNTRKPTADEEGADYIDKGVVKILKSHNPDKSEFPDIIITQEIEWFAWYDGK